MRAAAYLRQSGGRTARVGPCTGAVMSGTVRGAGQAGRPAQVEQAHGARGKRQQWRRCCGCGMRSVREFAGPDRPAKGVSAKGDRALAAGPRHTQQCAPVMAGIMLSSNNAAALQAHASLPCQPTGHGC